MVSINLEFIGSIKKISGTDNLTIEIPVSGCNDLDSLFQAIKNVMGDKILYNVYRNGMAISPDNFGNINENDHFQIVPVVLGG